MILWAAIIIIMLKSTSPQPIVNSLVPFILDFLLSFGSGLIGGLFRGWKYPIAVFWVITP